MGAFQKPFQQESTVTIIVLHLLTILLQFEGKLAPI